ncbi:MAG: hypothetical protein Q8881_03060 [Sweet potato little leaf phytoplasma]|nr:hypothetical protein [Sweet potato little leaf phytoplasma]
MAEFPPNFTLGTFLPKRPNFRRISHSGTFPPKRTNFHRISHSWTFPQKRSNFRRISHLCYSKQSFSSSDY